MTHLRLLRLWRGHGVSLVALVTVGVAISATWATQAVLLSQLFAGLLGGRSLIDPGLLPALFVVGAVLLVRPALTLTRAAIAHRTMAAVKRDLREHAVAALIQRTARTPGEGRSGADQATVTDGVENLDAYLSAYVPQLVVTGVVFLAVGTALVTVDPLIGVVAIVAAALLPLVPRLWDHALASRGSDHWEAYQHLHAEFVDSMRGMTTLVAFGQEERRERELAAASDTLLRRTLRQLSVSLVESGLSQFALLAVPALVLVLVAVRGGELSPFEMFAAVLLSIELVRPLRELAAAWHAGYLGTFSGPLVLDLVEEDRGRRDPLAVPRAEVELPLEVAGLTLRHPSSSGPVVQDASFRVDAGLTAVVGATGAGKSSIAAAVAGLLEPEAGTISLGGRVMSADELRARVSLVAQDPALFATDVRAETVLGAPTDADPVEEVAARVGIGTGESSLTLDTPLGDGGAVLSGGQRQRVAIARGDMQRRRVLLLDEATSALDRAAEARVISALRAARPHDAIIAVTHRLAVAEGADRVVVVEDGRVIEVGAPAELRQAGGAYATLLAAEASVAVPARGGRA